MKGTRWLNRSETEMHRVSKHEFRKTQNRCSVMLSTMQHISRFKTFTKYGEQVLKHEQNSRTINSYKNTSQVVNEKKKQKKDS